MESIADTGRDVGIRSNSECGLLVAVLACALVSSLAPTVAAAESVTDGLISNREDGCIVVAGAIVVDRVARSVTVPARVNQLRGTVEYVLVHTSGKRHEALFTTTVRPQHVHLACLLVGAPETDTPTPAGATVTAAVSIAVVWQGHGPAVQRAAESLLLPATHDGEPLVNAVMTAPDWRYVGSQFINDRFAAEVNGSCIALQADATALMSAPGLLASEFIPAASRLSPIGTPVSIVLTFRDAEPAVVQPIANSNPRKP